MADEKLYEEGKSEIGFEDATPDVIAKDMTINEAIVELQYMRDKATNDDTMKALDMAIDALFDEMISAERFKHFATKYGNYKEDSDDK